jgi:hypothetical protein
MAQFLSCFVAGQLSPERLTLELSIGRWLNSIQEDLYTQIFTDF